MDYNLLLNKQKPQLIFMRAEVFPERHLHERTDSAAYKRRVARTPLAQPVQPVREWYPVHSHVPSPVLPGCPLDGSPLSCWTIYIPEPVQAPSTLTPCVHPKQGAQRSPRTSPGAWYAHPPWACVDPDGHTMPLWKHWLFSGAQAGGLRRSHMVWRGCFLCFLAIPFLRSPFLFLFTLPPFPCLSHRQPAGDPAAAAYAPRQPFFFFHSFFAWIPARVYRRHPEFFPARPAALHPLSCHEHPGSNFECLLEAFQIRTILYAFRFIDKHPCKCVLAVFVQLSGTWTHGVL